MPVYQLTDQITFPPPDLARRDGLLAVGGDLSRERLLLAYAMGIFPWYSYGEPILWWSPNPRMILLPDEFHVSRSLERALRKGLFTVTLDTAFEKVIEACSAAPREGQDGTWITPEMTDAYIDLHNAGFAHSVECWEDGQLAGGLYGVSLGSCFLGESMFSVASNASKVALATLVDQLARWQFTLVDCQMHTEHLSTLGAREIPRRDFLLLLEDGLRKPHRTGPWTLEP